MKRINYFKMNAYMVVVKRVVHCDVPLQSYCHSHVDWSRYWSLKKILLCSGYHYMSIWDSVWVYSIFVFETWLSICNWRIFPIRTDLSIHSQLGMHVRGNVCLLQEQSCNNLITTYNNDFQSYFIQKMFFFRSWSYRQNAQK